MKNVSLKWWIAGACAGTLACGQSAVHAQVYHQWFKEKISPPAREASVDDYLIGMSKALGANCILDATGIEPQARVKPFPAFIGAVKGNWDTARLYVMDDFRAQASLAQQALGDYGTLLYWRGLTLDEETEAARLSRERHQADEDLVVEAKTQDEEDQTPRAAFFTSQYKPLQERWAKYFREVHGWDGKSNQVDITVKVADLPPDLRALTLAEVRYLLYEGMNLSVDPFSDEYWDTMRLIVDTREHYRETHKPIPYLSLRSPLSGPAGRIGNLDEPRQPAQEDEPAPPVQPVAQAAPHNTAPPAPLFFPDKFLPLVFLPEIESDPALQVKVSLEAKRRPLKALVGDLKQQSGVALALAPDAPSASAQVTLRVSEMPLWKMMASLSRIYGVAWSKDGADYTLRSAKLDPLNARLLRQGYAYHSMQALTTIFDLQQKQNNALARQIVRHLKRAELNSPQGAPLSDVPQELRDQVRKYFQEKNAQSILSGQATLDATPLEGLTLRFARLNIRDPDKIWWGRTAGTGQNAQMGAFTADGRFICLVFDRFGALAPREEIWLPEFIQPPGWQLGDPVMVSPPEWRKGDPLPVFPPDWKKGDPWPEWPKKQGAPPPQEQAAAGGP